MDYKTATNDELAAKHAEMSTRATTIFAMETPSVEESREAVTLVASISEIEIEQAGRQAVVDKAAAEFAAARAAFSTEDADDADEADDAEDDDADDAEDDDEAEDADDSEDAGDAGAVVTAAAADPTAKTRFNAKTAAKAVGTKKPRPARAPNNGVTITAAANLANISAGARIDGVEGIINAVSSKAKAFPQFNRKRAEEIRDRTGMSESLSKFEIASINHAFEPSLVASGSARGDYSAIKAAHAARAGDGATLTAAGWCAPSQVTYSYVADYEVTGLVDVAEINVDRGGIMMTTGPEHSSQGAALDDFGFDQTEAEAIARKVKTCETIVCPEFEEYRLDVTGYCFKIPILTQKAYPELITDAFRLADVRYAHKMNRRVISDMVAKAVPVSVDNLYGATFTDTLSTIGVLALSVRRKFNLGDNAVIEVVLPTIAREIFRADMSRRTGLALTDIATDQKIDAEFTNIRVKVQYVNDWQENLSADSLLITLPEKIQALVYPAGTFAKAIDDVINISTVYDAASLSVNEYTGVFFEQSYLLLQTAYKAYKFDLPVNAAGLTGAPSIYGPSGSI